VFHAARQDLEIFLHLFDALPTPVFDTQVAAWWRGMEIRWGMTVWLVP
jgi:ribonuclease D